MCPAWLLVFWYFWKSHFSFLYLTPSSYEIRTLLPHRTIYEVMGDQRWDECVLSPDELYSLPYSYTMSAVLVSLSREGNMPKGTCSTIRTIGRLWTTLLIPNWPHCMLCKCVAFLFHISLPQSGRDLMIFQGPV